jgi:hypothetical protein
MASETEMKTPAQEQKDKSLRLIVGILGAWNIFSFLMYLPGLSFQSNGGGEPLKWYVVAHMIMTYVIQPLVSAAGLALAYRNERLNLALVLVAIPWIFFFMSVAAFAIGVAIYGF